MQQGDPLGPLGFALALKPLTELIQEAAPDLSLHVWYLDDGTLCGSPDDLLRALNVISDKGPQFGLHLNKAKSKLFIPDGGNESLNMLPKEIPVLRGGLELLGAPIGPRSFSESVVQERVDSIQSLADKLHTLDDSHMAITLL